MASGLLAGAPFDQAEVSMVGAAEIAGVKQSWFFLV